MGAKFDCDWGTATEGGSQVISDVCYIRGDYVRNPSQSNATSSGGYLNDNLDIGQTEFAWKVDEFGNLYTGTTYKRYLSCYGEGTNRILPSALPLRVMRQHGT